MPDGDCVWTPPAAPAVRPQMLEFRDRAIERFPQSTAALAASKENDYEALWQWSVDRPEEFYALLWDFLGIKASVPPSAAVADFDKFPGAQFFPGARLNHAELLMRHATPGNDKAAYVWTAEGGAPITTTYAQLHDQVAYLAAALRAEGLVAGDRVCLFMPNTPEAAICMLAATSIGCTTASTSPDFGEQAVLDRFGQVQPKLVFGVDHYVYKNKKQPVLAKLGSIAKQLPSCKRVVVFSFPGAAAGDGGKLDLSPIGVSHAVTIDEFVAPVKKQHPSAAPAIQFEQLPFDHPVYIMFSSGTTGAPKCLVQGPGVVFNQLKEHVLHVDLRPEDRIFYYTTTGWMMWNWLTAALGVGATLLLWEGNPCYPKMDSLFEFAQEQKVTVFGTSAKYLGSLMDADLAPGSTYDLSSIRTILSTGSPATNNVFHYVSDKISEKVQFASISGGTDLNGCFALGCPLLPVHVGELQCRGLGLKVNVFDDEGKPCRPGEAGELVCETPFPSMPLHFLNDEDGKRYHGAYFDHFPNIWRHGDFAAIRPKTGGFVVLGRSDATLKPGGVRIGTAEIDRVIERIPEIEDSIVIGQPIDNGADVRVVLFVVLKQGVELDAKLEKLIKTRVRQEASPRHVPAVIMATPDIPYTMSGKKTEIAVRSLVQGKPVKNASALRNPESLEWYRTVAHDALNETQGDESKRARPE